MDQTPSPSAIDQLVWLFFKFDGRISRAAYFLAILLLNVVALFCLYKLTQLPEEEAMRSIWATGFYAIAFFGIWANFVLGFKRFHDFNKPGWLAIFCFIFPVIVPVALWFIPGTAGPNSYGPRTNARASS